MKSTEFITEGLGRYETILQNLLKIVNHPERKADKMNINGLLYDLGVGAQWNVRTHDHPLSNEMRKHANHFMSAFTHNFRGDTFSRQDIKQFADILFKWSEAVKDAPHKDYEDTSGL